MKAAGVNPVDTKIRQNGLFYDLLPPVILGCYGAGEFVAISEELTRLKLGDKVWFCHGGLGREHGNYAEFCIVEQHWPVQIPVLFC